jgi:hypothetical protein
MSTTTYNGIKFKIPDTIWNDWWLQIVEVLAEEADLRRDYYTEQKYYDDIDYNDITEDRLIEISEKFGYSPNLVLDNSISFIQKEIESIPFRIRNKNTIKGYTIIFDQIGKEGKVFNIVWNGTNLYRAVNWATTINAIKALLDYTEPMDVFFPIAFYDEILDNPVKLDGVFNLDSVIPWYLDVNVTNRVTKHLAIEYTILELCTVNGTDYLISNECLNYLYKGVRYNKKVISQDHAGGHVSAITDTSGYFNGIDNTKSYTIPDLLLKFSVTDNYSTDMSYIVYGIGTKGQIDESIVPDLWGTKVYHYGMDDENGYDVIDYAGNYNGTLTGQIVHEDGIVGRSIDFDGSTYVDVDSITIQDVDQTLSFWLNIDGTQSNANAYIIENQFITVYWVEATSTLTIIATGYTTSAQIDYVGLSADIDYFIQVELEIGVELRLFVNTVEVDQVDISSIGTVAGTPDLEIGYDGSTNEFIGIIDDVALHEKLYSSTEKSYIYDNKVGSLSHLSEKVFRAPLSQYEVYDNVEFTVGHGTGLGQYVEDTIAIGDGSTYVFTTNTVSGYIDPKTLRIAYEVSSVEKTVQDDGNGNIVGEDVSGTVNYTTGDIVLNAYENYLEENEINDSVGNYGSKTITTNNPLVQINTYQVSFVISSTTYICYDDGAGNVTGAGLTAGTINYTTGQVDLNFDGTTDLGSDIISTYQYRIYAIPDNASRIDASYYVTESIPFTECGIEDVNNNLVTYMTFPPAQLDDKRYHLSTQHIIKKT